MNLDNQQPMGDFSDDAAVAKADLYKAGKYSLKLIKMIQDGQELPGWVQAKIAKASDYISGVYHRMKFDDDKDKSEFGEHLDNAEMYEEHLKEKYQQKLMEARKNPKKMCKENNDPLNEGPFLGTKYTDINHPKYGKLELVNLGSFMMIVGEPGSEFNDIKGEPKEVQFAWKRLLKDVHEYKMKKGGFEPMSGAISRTSESRISEPSASMTKKKSPVVKQARAGKDLGKPGKGFEKVEKAAKKSGARDPKAVAASQMWKQQAKKG